MNQVEAREILRAKNKAELEQLFAQYTIGDLEVLVRAAVILSWEKNSSALSSFVIKAKEKLNAYKN